MLRPLNGPNLWLHIEILVDAESHPRFDLRHGIQEHAAFALHFAAHHSRRWIELFRAAHFFVTPKGPVRKLAFLCCGLDPPDYFLKQTGQITTNMLPPPPFHKHTSGPVDVILIRMTIR